MILRGGVPMSWVRTGRIAALMFCFLICVACGDVYRPTIIPNPVPTPDPKNFHAVLSVNQNGSTNRGSGMQVDVSGDSTAGITSVDRMPVHAALLGSRVWVANSLADSVSVFSEAAGTSIPIGSSININLAPGAAPVFVHSTESNTMYVANSGNATVSVINTINNVVTDNIPVSDNLGLGNPVAMAETPDGKTLYVVNQDANSVTSINTVDKSIANTICLTTPPQYSSAVPPPQCVAAVSPRWAVARSDSARIYVLGHDDGLLRTIDSTFGSPTANQVLSSVAVGAGASYLYYDSRRNRLYIPNPTTSKVGIYDVSADPPVSLATIDLTAPIPGSGRTPCPTTGCSPVSVTSLPDGTRAYVASYYIDNSSASCQQTSCLQAQVTVIDELTNQVTKSIALPQASVSPVGNCASARFRVSTAVAFDSSRVYVSSCDGTGIASINPVGDQYFAAIPAPGSSFSPTLLTITAAVQNGSNTTFSYTYDPNSGVPVFLGLVITISGVSQAADNGTFTVTGLGNGTFTVSNPAGQSMSNENGTGLGQPPGQNPVFILTGS